MLHSTFLLVPLPVLSTDMSHWINSVQLFSSGLCDWCKKSNNVFVHCWLSNKNGMNCSVRSHFQWWSMYRFCITLVHHGKTLYVSTKHIETDLRFSKQWRCQCQKQYVPPKHSYLYWMQNICELELCHSICTCPHSVTTQNNFDTHKYVDKVPKNGIQKGLWWGKGGGAEGQILQFHEDLWQWLSHYTNITLKIINCLRYIWYTHHFESWTMSNIILV
jgi:hypothetical protein